MPRPIEQTKALGNPGHRTGVNKPPTYVLPAATSTPEAPSWLQEPGKQAWATIWSCAHWLNVERDGWWVEQFARATDEVAVYKERIATDGLMLTGSMGQDVANPLISEIRKLEDQMIRIRRELGLSPSASAKLGLVEVKAMSALEAFKKEHQR